MKLSKLGIAFSATCAVLCVALIALWIHSYYASDFVCTRLASGGLSLQTDRGELGIWSVSPQLLQLQLPNSDWNFGSGIIAANGLPRLRSDDDSVVELFGFRFESIPSMASVLYVPFWAILLPVAAAGALPWIQWRFSWRIFVSTLCLLVTVLVIGFWVRSFKWIDTTDRSSRINICSMNGKVILGEMFMIMDRNSRRPGLREPIPDSRLGICSLRQDKFELIPLSRGVVIPYWLVILVVAPIAAAPWLRVHFSLRTMLIAMAVVSVLLFLVVTALSR